MVEDVGLGASLNEVLPQFWVEIVEIALDLLLEMLIFGVTFKWWVSVTKKANWDTMKSKGFLTLRIIPGVALLGKFSMGETC